MSWPSRPLRGDRSWFQSCRLPEWSAHHIYWLGLSLPCHHRQCNNRCHCSARRLSLRRIDLGKLSLFASNETGVPPYDGCLQPLSSRDFHESAFVVAAFALDREVDVERGVQCLDQTHNLEAPVDRLLGSLHEIGIDHCNVPGECKRRRFELIRRHHAVDETNPCRVRCRDTVHAAENDFL